MKVTTNKIFKNCYGRYGIAAVNVWCMEQVHGLFSAAQKANAPFIVQTTPVARNYAHAEMLLAMISAAAKIYPDTVFAIHLDHGNLEHAFDSIESGGYSSVMIDASHETFEKNISITKEVVAKAHLKNISVEAELGVLSGIEDDLNVDEKHKKYTQPSEVEEFVKQTGCDSLAVAVGTSHGAYKFSGEQGLQFGILKEIQKRLPGFPLVLHGGSGIPDEMLREAIKRGIVKVNLATDSKNTFMKELKNVLFNTDEIDLRKTFPPAIEAVKELIIRKIRLVSMK